MNKSVTQLELVPAAEVNGSPPTPLGPADLPTATAERILAEAGPDDFDWSNDDAVVIKPRPGVAVYENKFGNVVIRSQNIDDPGDDYFSFVAPEGLPAVIQALKDYLQ
jgi:hypothetical protein